MTMSLLNSHDLRKHLTNLQHLRDAINVNMDQNL